MQDLKQVFGASTLRGGNVITTLTDPQNENDSFEVQFEKHLGPDDDDEIMQQEEEW